MTACEASMQRHEMMTAMTELGLKGMAGAFDEAVTTGLQRKRTTMEVLTDLLRAEATHRHAASVRYRMSAARLPAVKDLDAFVFGDTPINEGLVRSLHSGSFLPGRRNVVLVGGTGTGKTHLATAITANVVRAGARGRYFNTVDLVNRLEEETRLGKAGTLAAQLSRLDLVGLDELRLCDAGCQGVRYGLRKWVCARRALAYVAVEKRLPESQADDPVFGRRCCQFSCGAGCLRYSRAQMSLHLQRIQS